MKVTLDRARDEIVEGTTLGRIGSAEDMAGAALYLASRAGAYVTGAVLVVDGGSSSSPSCEEAAQEGGGGGLGLYRRTDG